MRFIIGLALAAVLTLALNVPSNVEAGSNPACPPNYQQVSTDQFQNSPLRRRAEKADKNDDDQVCYKFDRQGPIFVDNIQGYGG